MDAKTYKQTLQAIFAMKKAEAENTPPYSENKYTYGDYLEGLNEGYIAGMREAIRTIEASGFLIEKQ